MKIMVVSLFLMPFLFLYFFGCAEGNKQGDTRLNALKSLIYNNADTTIKLDSTALKKLIQISTTGIFPNSKQRVSFYVYPKLKTMKLGIGQTAIYDGILTNDGNGYDDRTGVFTCPVAGTYMFVVDCLSTPGTWIHIMLNKNVVGALHVSNHHQSSPWVQISRTVIVKARKGDHVKVVNGDKSTSINHSRYSGFSGTLLY